MWSPRDSIETRIQQVAFLLQESTISGLYIFYAHRLLKPNSHIRERRVIWDLVNPALPSSSTLSLTIPPSSVLSS